MISYEVVFLMTCTKWSFFMTYTKKHKGAALCFQKFMKFFQNFLEFFEKNHKGSLILRILGSRVTGGFSCMTSGDRISVDSSTRFTNTHMSSSIRVHYSIEIERLGRVVYTSRIFLKNSIFFKKIQIFFRNSNFFKNSIFFNF
jgi:hypothetical protein